MNYFFICGLPRSRTAWLANLLTYGPSFCHHDALIECAVPSNLPSVMNMDVPRGTIFLGDSDSNLGLCWRSVIPMFPNAKVVFIERDRSEAIDAEYNAAVVEGYPVTKQEIGQFVNRIWVGTREFMANWKSKIIVDYNDIDIRCDDIWEHCLGDVPFSWTRFRMLQEFRVTQIFREAEKRINPNAGSFLLNPNERVLERETAIA